MASQAEDPEGRARAASAERERKLQAAKEALRAAEAKKAGLYVGCIWWREWSTNRWGEAQWERDLEKADVRLFMPQAGFALEFRIILPQ